MTTTEVEFSSIDELIRHITRVLLSHSDIDEGINTSLNIILKTTEVDRVYIFELWHSDEHGPMVSQVYERCAPGVVPEIDNPLLQNVIMIPDFERWYNAFVNNDHIGGLIVDFPTAEREYLEVQGIISLLVIPVMVNNQLVGFMGFDSTTVPREWNQYEIDLLKESSVLLGTLMMRKSQDLEIHRTEIQYKNLYDNMFDGVVYQAADGRITSANDAACDILGLTLDQMTGRTSMHPEWRTVREDMTPYPGEDHPAMVALRTGKRIRENLMGVYHPGKQEHRWISVNAIPEFRKGEATPYRVFTMFRDITDQIRYIKSLDEAKKKAEELNRLKSNIISNVSHEFRTPITGIMGFTSLLRQHELDSNALEFVDMIEKSTQRLNATLESIIDYSRMDSNLSDIRPRNISIRETLYDILYNAKYECSSKQLEFEANISGSDTVYIDDRYLTTIISNLLSNAIKFTKEGSVQLHLSTDDSQIELQITDTGIGIPEGLADEIFEPFRQGSEGLARHYEGAGLGLAIVKKHVDNIGGVISYINRKEGGVTFTVQLPVVSPRLSGGDEITSGTVDNLGHKILYVEDNRILRMLTRNILKHYDVDLAGSGEEALMLTENNQYDLLLLDINLGSGMSGIDLCKKLRSLPEYASVPAVAITAYSYDELEEDVANPLFAHYLSKPFQDHELLGIVRQYIHTSAPGGSDR